MVFARWESNFRLVVSQKVTSVIRMQNLLLILIGIIKMPCARFRRILIVAFFSGGPTGLHSEKSGVWAPEPVLIRTPHLAKIQL